MAILTLERKLTHGLTQNKKKMMMMILWERILSSLWKQLSNVFNKLCLSLAEVMQH
jgi:hypothetical protein